MRSNKKITIISYFTIALFSFTFFVLDEETSLEKTNAEKPVMNDEFQPLLARNEISFQKALSLSLNSVGTFTKPIPKSLQGIDLNVELPLDEDGNLIVGMEVKDLFEIYLSAIGEEELDEILLRIQNALAQQLHSPALEQGYDALKRFIDYKIELANLEKQTADPAVSELESIRRQKEILAAIQQEYFSPTETEALFAAETQYDDFMLEHLTIQQNEDLSIEEKQQQVEALEASLPEDIQAGRESAMAPATLYEQVQQMKSEGQSAEDIYQLRAESLGNEAASALAELDQQRAIWQQRLSDFNQQHESILTSGMSIEDQKTEVDALIARDFNALESTRLRAIAGI